jgi:hypothetical protein
MPETKPEIEFSWYQIKIQTTHSAHELLFTNNETNYALSSYVD